MRGVLLDLDGVVYVGDQPVPGAAGTVDWLAREGLPYRFLTKAQARARAEELAAERRATVLLPRAGEPGPAALRTSGRLRLPRHQDTSATLADHAVTPEREAELPDQPAAEPLGRGAGGADDRAKQPAPASAPARRRVKRRPGERHGHPGRPGRRGAVKRRQDLGNRAALHGARA